MQMVEHCGFSHFPRLAAGAVPSLPRLPQPCFPPALTHCSSHAALLNDLHQIEGNIPQDNVLSPVFHRSCLFLTWTGTVDSSGEAG